jgi:hypothetical protein
MFSIESHWNYQNTWKPIVCCLFSGCGINAFRMASSSSKSCACAYIAFLAGIFSWYADSMNVKTYLLTCWNSTQRTFIRVVEKLLIKRCYNSLITNMHSAWCLVYSHNESTCKKISCVELTDNERKINWKGFWRKRLWSNIKVLSRNSPIGTAENHEKPQDSRCPGRDLTRIREEVLPNGPRRSVHCHNNYTLKYFKTLELRTLVR